MKKSANIFTLLLVVVLIYTLCACGSAGVNQPGEEYMPDMGHSIAYEANYYDYYKYNRWGSAEEYYEMAKPRKPVMGTIPRGDAGQSKSDNPNALSIPASGSVPYYYEDTEEERTRAMNEITTNPFPITAEGLARAKPLYNVNCGICHGGAGDGNGWLVDEKNPNVKYPAQPAILINDEFTAASEGRFYHAIMYGKNVMGGYADKMSYEERWQVIHYIRTLQAKEKGLVYSEEKNTLNNVGVPGVSIPKKKTRSKKILIPTLAHSAGHGSGGDHGHDAGHGDGHGHDNNSHEHDAEIHDAHKADSHDGHDHGSHDGDNHDGHDHGDHKKDDHH